MMSPASSKAVPGGGGGMRDVAGLSPRPGHTAPGPGRAAPEPPGEKSGCGDLVWVISLPEHGWSLSEPSRRG